MKKPSKFSSRTHKLLWVSDLHLNHSPSWADTPPLWKSRGFDSIEHHDAWVRNLWQQQVDENTIVFNLGDPTFTDPDSARFKALTRYPGQQLLINGNHWSGQKQVYDGIARQATGSFLYPVTFNNLTFVGDQLHAFIDGTSVYMQHYPTYIWPELGAGGLHLHGHCHRRCLELNPENTTQGKILDVGVDNAIVYAKSLGREPSPFFTWDDIKAIMARKPVVQRDHH